MKNSLIIALSLAITGFLAFTLSDSNAQVTAAMRSSDDIAVVVNNKNITNELSTSDVRSILLGERRFWKSREPLKLVLREPGTPERDDLIVSLLRMTNEEYGHHWRDKIFRGEAPAAPLTVPSNGVASQYVYDTPGAITFVLARNLRPDLKILKIDGKMPGDPGYPLR